MSVRIPLGTNFVRFYLDDDPAFSRCILVGNEHD